MSARVDSPGVPSGEHRSLQVRLTRTPLVPKESPVDENALTLPEDMTALTVPQLRELHGTFTARIAELRALEAMTVAQARELRDLVGSANTIAETINEASAVMPDAVDLPDDAPPVEIVPPVVEGEGGDAAPVVEGDEVVPTPEAIAAGIAAGELDVSGGAAGQRPSEGAAQLAPAAFVAAIGQHIASEGSDLSIEQVGAIFSRARDESRRVRAGEETKHPLFSVNRYGPTESFQKLSSQNGHVMNSRIISGLPQHARTAAICGPLDIVRAIPNCVENSRVVRGMFRNIPAERGAFQFLRSVGLADVDDGVPEGGWSDTDQDGVDPGDPSTWKPCHALECGDPVEVEVTAIPSCLTVDAKQEFSAPEQIENNIQTLSA